MKTPRLTPQHTHSLKWTANTLDPRKGLRSFVALLMLLMALFPAVPSLGEQNEGQPNGVSEGVENALPAEQPDMQAPGDEQPDDATSHELSGELAGVVTDLAGAATDQAGLVTDPDEATTGPGNNGANGITPLDEDDPTDPYIDEASGSISGLIWYVDDDMIGRIGEDRIAEHATPVAGYMVRLYTESDLSKGIYYNAIVTETNQDGIYIFDNLPADDYVLALSIQAIDGYDHAPLVIEDDEYQRFGYGEAREGHIAFSDVIPLSPGEGVDGVNGGLLRITRSSYSYARTLDLSFLNNVSGNGVVVNPNTGGGMNGPIQYQNTYDPRFLCENPAALPTVTFTSSTNGNAYHLIQTGKPNNPSPKGSKYGTGMASDIIIQSGVSVTLVISGIDVICPITLQGSAHLTLVLDNNDQQSPGPNYVRNCVSAPPGTSLNIKSYVENDNGSGTLNIDPSTMVSNRGSVVNARIGGRGGESAGTIVIDSGTFNLRPTANNDTMRMSSGALIGGGAGGYGTRAGDGGNITINGGIFDMTTATSGAGIGGGGGGNMSGPAGDGGDITINNGSITIEAHSTGAGIGGGGAMQGASGSGGEGGNITINGGNITINQSGWVIASGATGIVSGACMGGGGGFAGDNEGSIGGSAGNTVINNGTVTLTNHNRAAALGAGTFGGPGHISITGGNVTALVSGDSETASGSAIGGPIGTGSSWTGASTINISGGNVHAEANFTGIGLGHGAGTLIITISGGDVYAYGNYGPGIGFWSGADINDNGADAIILTGGNIIAQSEMQPGIGGTVPDNDGSWLPAFRLEPGANVKAYSRGTEGSGLSVLQNSSKPAIWTKNNSGSGYYVNASYINGAPSSSQATSLIVTRSGDATGTILKELTLPARYRHFAYSTGTDSARNDSIRASRGGGAYRSIVRNSDSSAIIPSILVNNGYSSYQGARGALPVREGTDSNYFIREIHVYIDGTDLSLVNDSIQDSTTPVVSGGNYSKAIGAISGFTIAGYKVDARPNTSGSDFIAGTTATISGPINSNRTVYFVYGPEVTYNYRYWVYFSNNPTGSFTFINSKHWLADAVALCVSQTGALSKYFTIVLATENDPDVSDNHNTAVIIPAGMNITLTSTIPAQAVSTRRTITQIGNARHLIVNGELTLDNIVLQGRGYNFTNNYPGNVTNGGIDVRAGGTLDIYDNALIQRCFTHIDNDDAGGAIVVRNNGSLNMHGGLISSNEARNGSAVYVEGNPSVNGSFTMNGGTISGNRSTPYMQGGAPKAGYGTVLLDGRMDMFGGTISGNTACCGGGIAVGRQAGTAAELVTYGGTISGNTATLNGGGVIVHGRLYMLGGTIGGASNGNTAIYSGGGVYISGGDMPIMSGTVSYNQAASGGGVTLNEGNLLLMAGSITRNTAVSSPEGGSSVGGGVYVMRGTFNMTGGSITYNREGDTGNGFGGGGVCMAPPDGPAVTKFTLSAGTISNNQASAGGGVMIWRRCTFNMIGGEITNNQAVGDAQYPGEGRGGGVVVYQNATFNFENGTISSNSAVDNGGGIYVSASNGTLITGTADGTGTATITNNRAPNGHGGGIYSADYARITIASNTVFSGNTASEAADTKHTQAEYIAYFQNGSYPGHYGVYSPYNGTYSTCPGFTAKHPVNNYDINANYYTVTEKRAEVYSGNAVYPSLSPVRVYYGASYSKPIPPLSVGKGIGYYIDDSGDGYTPVNYTKATSITIYPVNDNFTIFYIYQFRYLVYKNNPPTGTPILSEHYLPTAVQYCTSTTDHYTVVATEDDPDVYEPGELLPISILPNHTITITSDTGAWTLTNIEPSRHFEIYGNGTLILENVILQGKGYNLSDNQPSNSSITNGGIYVRSNGNLIMNSGAVIQKCYSNNAGGAMRVDGTVTMNSGIIRNNITRAGDGGGVELNGSSRFTMGTANVVTGVTPPEICDNLVGTSTGNGGGVYVSTNSLFTFNRGYIRRNLAPQSNGGGIYTDKTSDYSNLVINANAVFADNVAKTGIDIKRDFAWVTAKYPTIKSSSHSDCTTAGFTALHPLNNYDINSAQRFTVLSLSKTVQGNFSDTKKPFNFTLTFMNNANGTVPLAGTFKYYTSDPAASGSTVAGTFTINSSGSATVTLKHGERIYIDGVPDDCYVKIVEDDYSSLHYEATYTDSGSANPTLQNKSRETAWLAMTAARTIGFTNDRSGIPIVGVDTGNNSAVLILPFMILEAVEVGLVWKLFRKRLRRLFRAWARRPA